MIEACRRHFRKKEFSSGLGLHRRPFICMLSQRIQHGRRLRHRTFTIRLSLLRARQMLRLLATKAEMKGLGRNDPFHELHIRTWRDLARYQDSEALR
jgi:hypothetical protein